MSQNTFQQSITPYLTVSHAEAAIAFYEKVLGAECTFRVPAEDGRRLMHATLLLRDNIFNLSDEFPEFGGHSAPDKKIGSPAAVSVRFDKPADVDRIYKLALENGGSNSWPPEDMFWGDRFCQFVDPSGHRWMLTALLEQT